MNSAIPLFKIKTKNKGEKEIIVHIAACFVKDLHSKKFWAHYRKQYLEKQKLTVKMLTVMVYWEVKSFWYIRNLRCVNKELAGVVTEEKCLLWLAGQQ